MWHDLSEDHAIVDERGPEFLESNEAYRSILCNIPWCPLQSRVSSEVGDIVHSELWYNQDNVGHKPGGFSQNVRCSAKADFT